MSGGTNDSAMRHALDLVFRWLGQAVTTFSPVEGAPASSLAHDLLEMLLADRTAMSDRELGDLYDRALQGTRLLMDMRHPHLVSAVRYHPALRNLFNRMIGQLHHCLTTRQNFTEAIAFAPPPSTLTAAA